MTGSNVAPIKQPTGFELELAQHEASIAAALPAHITTDRFKRVIITAINQNPKLIKADRRTLFTSCIRAAQDGLLPDGREAALVIFRTKNKQTGEWKDAVQYMPMVAGIIKRMRNSGDVASVDSQIVCRKDEFTYRLGDDPKIEHKPALGDRGEPVAAYAIIKLTNGEVLREVMGVAEIEKVRAVSRSKDDGPWVTWWEEMARKTVLRRCSKRAPVSSDLDEILRRGDEDDYAARSHAPIDLNAARPTRAQFHDQRVEQSFIVTTGDGEDLHYESAEHACEGMTEAINTAAKIGQDAVDGVWESNGFVLSQLRERGHPALADALKNHYTATIARLQKPPAEEKAASNETAKKDTPAAAEAKPAEASNEAAKSDKAPEPPKEPQSPLKHKKAEWPAWVEWAIGQINTMDRAKVAGFIADRKEFDFIGENRSGDWDRIMLAVDARRTEG